MNRNILYSIDYQYFGSIDYILNLINYTNICFLSNEQQQKTMHLNRTWLYGPNNLVGLSIPLKGGRNAKQLIRDIQVADDPAWKRIHWRTLHDCYRKSPWFDEYADELRTFFEADHKFLADWCRSSCEWVLEKLGKNTDILTEYSDAAEIIQVSYEQNPVSQVPQGYPLYQQVFSERRGFAANLSILDLLMNEGPLSFSYLDSCTTYKKSAGNSR